MSRRQAVISGRSSANRFLTGILGSFGVFATLSRRAAGASQERGAGRRAVPRSGRASRAEALDQPLHEALARLELFNGDEFVGLVRLGDIARSADHGRIAPRLEMSRLGAVADHVPPVVPGDRAGQSLGVPGLFGRSE